MLPLLFNDSGAYIIESKIWTTLGKAPWAEESEWYVKFTPTATPIELLECAAKYGCYTLIDNGTPLIEHIKEHPS